MGVDYGAHCLSLRRIVVGDYDVVVVEIFRFWQGLAIAVDVRTAVVDVSLGDGFAY